MAICCVSDIIQAAYVDGYTARPELFRFLASHHFFSGLRVSSYWAVSQAARNDITSPSNRTINISIGSRIFA
jgi:hypothetical protein